MSLETLRWLHLPACEYCGRPADTRDHVTPKHWRWSSVTVPACRRCNSEILGGVPLFSVEARRAHILGHRSVPQNTPSEPSGGISETRPVQEVPTYGVRLRAEGGPIVVASSTPLIVGPEVRYLVLPKLNRMSAGWHVKGIFYPRRQVSAADPGRPVWNHG